VGAFYELFKCGTSRVDVDRRTTMSSWPEFCIAFAWNGEATS
jgi:hypothetical protein